MSTFFTWLTSINTTDADLRRRGRNLVILALSVAMMALAFLPFSFNRPNAGIAVTLIVVCALTYSGAAFLGRLGMVNQGATLFVSVVVLGSLGAVAANDPTAAGVTAPFYLVLAILLAGVLLPPIHIWTALTATLIGLALVTGGMGVSAELRQSATNSSLMLIVVAAISFVSARGTRAALAEADSARRAADNARRDLAASNTALEQRVEERTAALRQIAEEHRAAAAALQASLQSQEQLNRIVAEQAVPVIPVSAGTLVVPLIGSIDGERADHILATILGQIERTRARTVILDVTGVALVDTHVAAGLLRVAQATGLMGTTTILAGIRPEVAQALVGLGVDLGDLHTVATLQEAL